MTAHDKPNSAREQAQIMEVFDAALTHAGIGRAAVSTATNGRRREHNVRDDLTGNGYLVFRMAGSKGAADLIAFKPGQVLFVQVKPPGGANIGPTDRGRLRAWAEYAGAIPLVATKGPRGQGYLYRRLTGPGPKQWEPWTPDEVGTP